MSKVKFNDPTKRCANCAFGEKLAERIQCHRYPPASDGKGSKSKDTQPIMSVFDWCGEHTKK